MYEVEYLHNGQKKIIVTDTKRKKEIKELLADQYTRFNVEILNVREMSDEEIELWNKRHFSSSINNFVIFGENDEL